MNENDLSTVADQAMAYEMVYPEIYYRVQPFVMGVCDQLEIYGGVAPSSEVIQRIADNIYTDVVAMYPDLADYSAIQASASADYAQPAISPSYRRRFRRRGLFRDFVEILLLNEIFRRL